MNLDKQNKFLLNLIKLKKIVRKMKTFKIYNKFYHFGYNYYYFINKLL